MDVVFKCLQNGRRYYGVWRNGLEIFVGSRDECDRYLELLQEKVAQAQREAQRVPRSGPIRVTTYRATRA